MAFQYKQFHRRKLPHLHSPGATLFVTFRLAGSIPKSLLVRWKLERDELDRNAEVETRSLEFQRRWFGQFEECLHSGNCGPLWLKDPLIAGLVADSLKYRDGEDYHLIAFSIMPNHVHVVFRPLVYERHLTEIPATSPRQFESSVKTPSAIMQSLKGYTARQANKLLGRTGKFWQDESYDHVVRDEDELNRIVNYVLNNPVKAGLVENWRDHKWTWLKE